MFVCGAGYSCVRLALAIGSRLNTENKPARSTLPLRIPKLLSEMRYSRAFRLWRLLASRVGPLANPWETPFLLQWIVAVVLASEWPLARRILLRLALGLE